MRYEKQITLANGKTLILRNGNAEDAAELLRVYLQVHEETDYLLSYRDENTMTESQEADFLQAMEDSPNEIELLAFIDGVLVGCAGVNAVGRKYKVRHRATFGIGVIKDYWHMGIGRAMTLASIECARGAGYLQLELDVVAENTGAISLYESVGFTEYGRNPQGIKSRISGFQELVSMRMGL